MASAPAERPDARLSERAHQDREIVYFLQQPETHAFDLYHDYTESRPGVDKYLNVVRAGSKASNPSARILDTGESLTTRTLKGNAITAAHIDIGEPVKAATEVVVIDFPAIARGSFVAPADQRDVHRPGPLPPQGRHAGVGSRLRAAGERHGPPRRMGAGKLFGAGDGLAHRRRQGATRLRESAE